MAKRNNDTHLFGTTSPAAKRRTFDFPDLGKFGNPSMAQVTWSRTAESVKSSLS